MEKTSSTPSGESYRICPICEAACGLRVSIDDGKVTGIRPNDEDVFSTGHACAKGIALADLHQDPDRLRTPLVRRDGELQPTSWAGAFSYINSRLASVRAEGGNDAIALYVGNPTAHNIGLSLGIGPLAMGLGTSKVFTAASVDQLPKHLASELMFGNGDAIPVPDIQRADLIVMLGANPVVSNGSLWIVPKFRDKLRDFKARGGTLVTVDPRRNETARLADDHLFIRPGADALFLTALIQRLLARGFKLPASYPAVGAQALFDAIDALGTTGLKARTGISEAELENLADSIEASSSPVFYGRVGTTLQAFGTLTSFLIEVLNLLTGALDQAGGAMFPEQPFAKPATPFAGIEYNRFQTRISQYPEVQGQMPCAALAEEIEEPGDGQIRALFCLAGNPVVSNPDSDRLGRALESLDLLVCIDIYHNETTRLADVILPGTSPFEEVHYDSFLGSMGYRNAARYSPALIASDRPDEWQTGLTLGYVGMHQSVPDEAALSEFEDTFVAANVGQYVADETGPLHGRDVQEITAAIEPEAGVERLLDLGIRAGRWGDHFGERDGLTLARMRETPDGIDLGELRAGRLAEVVSYPDGQLQLAPEIVLTELQRLAATPAPAGFSLIGKRRPQSNNSWLRNLPVQNRGKPPCTLEMHRDDAEQLGINEGETAILSANGVELEVSVETSVDIAVGVVSLPHGYSQDLDIRQRSNVQGVNYNRLVAAGDIDAPSSTSAMNGVTVTITKR